MNKLLEKAKKSQKRYKGNPKIKVTTDEVELAVTFLNGEISTREYAFAMGFKKPGQVTHRIASVLRYGIENELIKITLKKSL